MALVYFDRHKQHNMETISDPQECPCAWKKDLVCILFNIKTEIS